MYSAVEPDVLLCFVPGIRFCTSMDGVTSTNTRIGDFATDCATSPRHWSIWLHFHSKLEISFHKGMLLMLLLHKNPFESYYWMTTTNFFPPQVAKLRRSTGFVWLKMSNCQRLPDLNTSLTTQQENTDFLGIQVDKVNKLLSPFFKSNFQRLYQKALFV